MQSLTSRLRYTLGAFTLSLAFIGLYALSHRPTTALMTRPKIVMEKLPSDLPRIVVSVSSFGQRLSRIGPMIDSIVKQEMNVDKIYVHVPLTVDRLKMNSTIPAEVLALEEAYPTLLQVNRPEHDFGPATKLLGTLLLEDDPKTIIITVDDDVTYPPTLIGHLVQAMLSSIAEPVIPTYMCEVWKDPWIPYTNGHVKIFNEIGECHGWQATWAGSAYRRSYFSKTVLEDPIFDYSMAPKGCRLHDDVWISGVLYRKHIRPYRISTDMSMHHHAKYTNESIHLVDNGERDYRDPCIAFFDHFV